MVSNFSQDNGIVIDTKNIEVVCWPFRKFGNYTEDYADKNEE